MSNKVDYNDQSIDQLLGADRIRRRPASMLGSSSISGARHGFTEIYGNSLDEVSSGYGSRLDVTYYADSSVSIRDYGRGVPMGWNDKRSTWNWHIIFNDLYGGGKYDNNQNLLAEIRDWGNFDEKKFNYLYSVGLNGLGSASTQYTSEFFNVRSYKDGVCTEMNFKKGVPIFNGEPVDVFRRNVNMEELAPTTTETTEPNGTFIHWKPDSEVFSETDIGGDWLFSVCEDIAHVAGVTLVFKNEKTGFETTIEAGSVETLLTQKHKKALKKVEGDESIVYRSSQFDHGNTTVEGKPFIWVCKVDCALAPATKTNKVFCYHNSVKMGGGTQYEGVYQAIQTFFTGLATKEGIKLELSDYAGVLAVAVSSYSNYASFKGQTKDEVDNEFIRNIVYKAVIDKLNMEYGKGSKVIFDLVENVLNEARTRIAIKELAKQVRETKKITRAKDPEKFASCKSYMKNNASVSELWIVEGDSALGSVKSARNSDFQAILPVRGKCLNPLKASLDKIIKNEVIKNIFSVLGTGMDIGQEGLFDINALRFDKIIFATDADVDGFQIRVLLFCIFYKLAPRLISEGHVYIAETPRFELKLSNGEVLYARDDTERDKLVKEHGAGVSSITRFKGLGEASPEMLRKTTIHPDTRNLVSLKMDLANISYIDLIDALFGADRNKQRKKILINELGEDIGEMLDANAVLYDSINGEEFEENIDTVEVNV